MKTQELESIIYYSAGICLCGHEETCSVCDRDQYTRNFEALAKRAAKELLAQVSPGTNPGNPLDPPAKEVTNAK